MGTKTQKLGILQKNCQTCMISQSLYSHCKKRKANPTNQVKMTCSHKDQAKVLIPVLREIDGSIFNPKKCPCAAHISSLGSAVPKLLFALRTGFMSHNVKLNLKKKKERDNWEGEKGVRKEYQLPSATSQLTTADAVVKRWGRFWWRWCRFDSPVASGLLIGLVLSHLALMSGGVSVCAHQHSAALEVLLAKPPCEQTTVTVKHWQAAPAATGDATLASQGEASLALVRLGFFFFFFLIYDPFFY